MNDSVEENTHWVCMWILNDPAEELYWGALDVAREARRAGDYDILRNHLEDLLRKGVTPGAVTTAREMSDADYDNTDWKEVADVLLSE